MSDEVRATAHQCLLTRFGCVFPTDLPGFPFDNPGSQSDDSTLSAGDFVTRLTDALDKDFRVDQLTAPARPRYDFPTSLLSDWRDDLSNDPLERLDAATQTLHAPVLEEPLTFTVSVPEKHQYPAFLTDDERARWPTPAARDYIVVWSGSTFLVAWTQRTDSPTRYGGHVVWEVLMDALRAAGFSPRRQYPTISHESIRVRSDMNVTEAQLTEVPDGDGSTLDLAVPIAFDPVALATFTFAHLGAALRALYGATSARNSFHLSAALQRADLQALLRLQLESASRHLGFGRAAIRSRWTNRHWRRQSRQLIARLWYSMTVSAGAAQKITDDLDFLSQLAREFGVGLFTFTATEIRREIESFQAPAATEAIDHAARALDNRDLAAATIIASGVGLAVGSGLTILL